MNRGLVLSLLLVICGGFVSGTEVKGVAIICDLPPKSLVGGLEVRVFDAAKVPRLVAAINALESPSLNAIENPYARDSGVTRRLDAMIRIATTPAARAITHKAGTYHVNIPAGVKRIIVFGYAEREDYPYFYVYKQVPVSQPIVDVELDMGGFCSDPRR